MSIAIAMAMAMAIEILGARDGVDILSNWA
jgi:hypothetical protein